MVSIGGKKHRVLVADTPDRWSYGLMNVQGRADICGYDGMIFTFPVEMPQTFWNESTFINLDLYWMRDRTVIGSSRLDAISEVGKVVVQSPGPVDAVVEILSD